MNDGDKVIVAVNCIMETMDLIEKNYDYTVNVNRGNQSLVERFEETVGVYGEMKTEIIRLKLILLILIPLKNEEWSRNLNMKSWMVGTGL